MTDQDRIRQTLESQLRLVNSLTEAISLDASSYGYLDPRDMGIGDTPPFAPPVPSLGLAFLNRLKRGEYIPAFLNEPQLSWLRRRVRATVVNNEIALNAVNQRINYAVGNGLNYEVTKRVDGCPDALVERAQQIVDMFVELNDMSAREAEIVSRIDIDGEAFLRIFPRRGGILAVRFIEPEHIFSPVGDSNASSFGILTDPLDVENVKGYHVVQGLPDQGAKPELVDACEIIHLKHPETPLTSKRGLSAFYAIEPTLRAAEDLLTSTVYMAKARAKIAWVEKLAGTSATLAQALADNKAAYTATDPQSQQSINIEKIRYGSIFRMPATSELEMPSANIAASDHVAVMQMVLRIIAARFSMPEYLLTSDASNGSYASTLVAESPFVKAMSRHQAFLGKHLSGNRYGDATKSLLWRQLSHATECGLLPSGLEKLIDIQCVGPSLIVRDNQKEANVDKIYHEMGVKSIKTIRMEQDLDDDTEEANLAEEAEQQAAKQKAMQPPQMHGMPPPGGMLPGQPQPSPLPSTGTPTDKPSMGGIPRQEWLEVLREAEAKAIGDVWQGASGRWFTKNTSGKVVPAKNPNAKPPEPKEGGKDKDDGKAGKKPSGKEEKPKAKSKDNDDKPSADLDGAIESGDSKAIADVFKSMKLSDLRKKLLDMGVDVKDRSLAGLADKAAKALVEKGKAVPPGEKAPIDLKQSKPDHPVAKALRENEKATKLLSGMSESIKKWRASSPDVEALDIIRKQNKAWVDYLGAIGSEARKKAYSEWRSWKAKARAKKITLDAEYSPAFKAKIAELKASVRSAVVDALKAENPYKFKINDYPGVKSSTGQVYDDPYTPTDEDKEVVNKALDFIGKIVEGKGKDMPLEIKKSKDGRAFYNSRKEYKDSPLRFVRLQGKKDLVITPYISMGKQKGDAAISTTVHEIGHLLEEMKPGVMKKVREFMDYRFGLETPVDIGTIPGGELMKGEKGRKDNFDRLFEGSSAYYVGKEYAGGESELVSMGVQALYDDPEKMLEADPEFATFILSILHD